MNHELSPEDLDQIKALLSSNQLENNEIVFSILEGYGLIPSGVRNFFNNRYKYKIGEQKFRYQGGENILDIRVKRNNIYFYLNLNDLKLKEIPAEIGLIQNLKEINLSQNNLTSIPEELTNLKYVEKLSIAYNKNIHTDCFQIIQKFRQLKVLNISGCSLTSFPEELLDTKGLEVIYLESNMLTTLPPEISQLENLYYLDLSRNCFSKFPYQLYNTPSLETLLMEYNRFTPAQIVALKRSKKKIKIKF